MPRVKVSTPQRLGGSSVNNPISRRKSKGKEKNDKPFQSKIIIREAVLGTPLIGSEPLRCVWHNPEFLVLPSKLTWSVNDSEEPEFFADSVRIFPTIPVLAALLQHGIRKCDIVCCGANSEELLLDFALTVLPFPKAAPLMNALCNGDYSSDQNAPVESGGTTWQRFFKELAEIQSTRPRASIAEYQDPDLLPTLRGYQADAVAWMIQREEYLDNPLNLDWLREVSVDVPTRGSTHLIYNKYSQTINISFDAPKISSGGILADEMGLGKTVITLALILKHRRTIENDIAEVDVSRIDDRDETTSKSSDGEDYSLEDDSSSDYEEISRQRVSRKRSYSINSSECDQTSLKQRKKTRNSSRNSQNISEDDIQLSVRVQNLETSLNADEELQLVPTSGKGQNLRACLNKWYESKLNEVKVTPRRAKKKACAFRCICGDEEDYLPRGAVKCSECDLYQHASCVGYKRNETYICPSCWKSVPPVKSSATLIIVPPAIFHQWGSEAQRHTPTLKLLMYEGIPRGTFLPPSNLAKYDVVVTTYPVLVSEIHYNESSNRQLRQESRFLRLSSPLTCVSWWRVVCDEAQQFEVDGSKVRIMVNQLSAVHRWSVTGTPIQKGISDLFYLTQFMGLGPLDDKTTWTDFLLKPYLSGCKTPLLSVLNQVFWRSTKDSVGDELGLPQQTFRHHFLKFSSIEELFYMQEHTNSSANFLTTLSRSKMDPTKAISSIDKGTLKKLLQPLLNLRQACTHAQVVSGVNITSSTGAANLSELLTYLSRKTKQECEEMLRRYVNGLNGTAGLLCLLNKWPEAMEKYRCVFRVAEEYKDIVQVDSLQRIHALTSAADILEEHREVITSTLRDEHLREEATELERKYVLKAHENLRTSFQQANFLKSEVLKIRETFESSPDSWWFPMILKLSDFETELLNKIENDMQTNEISEKTAMRTYLNKLRSLRSIEIVAKDWWDSLEFHREKALSALEKLSVPTNVIVKAAVECHIRPIGTSKAGLKCDLCKMEKIMLDLECELFYTRRKDLRRTREKVTESAGTKGSWKPHNVDRTLQIVVSFARNKVALEKWCTEDAKRYAKLMDNMKKEFKQVRAVWTELNMVAHAEDELNMSKIRFCLATEPAQRRNASRTVEKLLGNEKPDKLNYVLQFSEIHPMLINIVAETNLTLSEFKKKLGQMKYLQNLGRRRNCVPDPCPVCQGTLEGQWCVLQCGHCFCINCIRALNVKCVKCPVCRELTESSGLSFVDTTLSVDTSNISVYGDFSTKIDAMVRTCLEILNENRTTKMIIFSTWVEVLKILEEALKLNKVKVLHLKRANHQKTLKEFRDSSSDVSALLLPLSWGAKGLNLIEATHVLLAEPILNPAEELQAIGRVHRIGQTKPTFVHRFLVRGTIEDKIYSTVSEAKDKWDKNTITLADLKNLFVIPDANGENEQ